MTNTLLPYFITLIDLLELLELFLNGDMLTNFDSTQLSAFMKPPNLEPREPEKIHSSLTVQVRRLRPPG